MTRARHHNTKPHNQTQTPHHQKPAATSSDHDAAAPKPPPPLHADAKQFTPAAPPTAPPYDFSKVPAAQAALDTSVLLRLTARTQWFATLKELEACANESLVRRAARLRLPSPSGLPLVYVADRMDIDDPLWGYQVRCAQSGRLQGFITCTVFTTWTHYFEWNSLHASSGICAARVANALAHRPDKVVVRAEPGETLHELASRVGARCSDLAAYNAPRFGPLHPNSRLLGGARFYIDDPARADTIAALGAGETPAMLAARAGVPVRDFVAINQALRARLSSATRLQAGETLLRRDRSVEPEVFLPTNRLARALDDDGRLAAELQRQARNGDPTTTGVVWPRVAELALLAGLGCGKTLVRLVLEELAASGSFDFVVLQATMASVSFYEEMGFVRVGALARYANADGAPLDSAPLQGYRHWASADETQLEQFGETSYMMALRLKGVPRKRDERVGKKLAKRLVADWPAVRVSSTVNGKKGKALARAIRQNSGANVAGIGSAGAVRAGNLSVVLPDADDARLQLFYEVERVLDVKFDRRGDPERYLVKWRHCGPDEATWEAANTDPLGSDAAKDEPAPQTALHNFLRGGLGELQPRVPTEAADAANKSACLVPEREHRYWFVMRHLVSTGNCVLLPLIASGRFGGSGRRAGRVRWLVAHANEGHEREVHVSVLTRVVAESVTGVRQPEGVLTWSVEEADCEQAAREQAAAARSRRRQMLDEEGAVEAIAMFERAVEGYHVLPRKVTATSAAAPAAAAAADAGLARAKRAATAETGRSKPKKPRLEPASRTCLACTRGKHSAHTCGVRGKKSSNPSLQRSTD